MSRDVELAVVGAGPQALTLLCYLAHHRPDMLPAVAVFDAGDWLAAWPPRTARRRFRCVPTARCAR